MNSVPQLKTLQGYNSYTLWLSATLLQSPRLIQESVTVRGGGGGWWLSASAAANSSSAAPVARSDRRRPAKKQVASMCLRRPKKPQVPTMDPSKASRRPVGNLLVKVVRAQNLEKKGLLGRSDPYVKLKMSGNNLPSKKTTVKRSNLNPEWNEYFKFVVLDLQNQSLNVNVFDRAQIGKHEKMGMNRIRLKELPPEETEVTTLNLLKTIDPNDVQNEISRGQITLEVTYKPFEQVDMEKESTDGTDEVQKKAPEPMEKKSMDNTDEAQKAPYNVPTGGGLLLVVVHEAQDLEGKHHTNPYTKITFKGQEKKTKVIKKNRDPRWEDEFEFDCEEPPTDDKLHVEVLSKAGKIGVILHGKVRCSTRNAWPLTDVVIHFQAFWSQLYQKNIHNGEPQNSSLQQIFDNFSSSVSFNMNKRETLGYIDIALADVISRKRTNDKFHLIDSKNGQIQIELQWRT